MERKAEKSTKDQLKGSGQRSDLFGYILPKMIEWFRTKHPLDSILPSPYPWPLCALCLMLKSRNSTVARRDSP